MRALDPSPSCPAWRVLCRLALEPGEWTDRELADELGMGLPEVREGLRTLQARGCLEPRAYRLHAGVGIDGDTEIVAGPSEWARRLVGPWDRDDAQRTRALILDAVRVRPLSAPELASALGAEQLSGSHKGAAAWLHRHGLLSLPVCPWPSAVGLELVADHAEGAA